MPSMGSRSILSFAAASLAALVLAVAGCSRGDSGAKTDVDCELRASLPIGGPISLIDETGARVTEANFRGRPALVFFGYTYCPDACPSTLFTVGRALQKLPEGTPQPRTMMISIDPARDTPEQLKRYVASNGFPPDMKGLTGSEDEITAAATAFKATFARSDEPGGASGYAMEHTSILYLMDENWKLRTFFTLGTRPEAMAQCIAKLLR